MINGTIAFHVRLRTGVHGGSGGGRRLTYTFCREKRSTQVQRLEHIKIEAMPDTCHPINNPLPRGCSGMYINQPQLASQSNRRKNRTPGQTNLERPCPDPHAGSQPKIQLRRGVGVAGSLLEPARESLARGRVLREGRVRVSRRRQSHRSEDRLHARMRRERGRRAGGVALTSYLARFVETTAWHERR